MTREEILFEIGIIAQATRELINVQQDEKRIKIYSNCGAFAGSFVSGFGAFCDKNYIGYAVGADTQPYILLSI